MHIIACQFLFFFLLNLTSNLCVLIAFNVFSNSYSKCLLQSEVDFNSMLKCFISFFVHCFPIRICSFSIIEDSVLSIHFLYPVCNIFCIVVVCYFIENILFPTLLFLLLFQHVFLGMKFHFFFFNLFTSFSMLHFFYFILLMQNSLLS